MTPESTAKIKIRVTVETRRQNDFGYRARLTVTEAYRGPDGQALFGPEVKVPR
jgi:hypothetical protein